MLGVVLAICALLGVTDVASGQVPTGIIPFGSYDGSVDTVNLANLNVHLDIPIRQKAGRGLPFRYDLAYDSSILYPSTVGGGGTWLPVANWGWKNSGPTLLPYVSYSVIYTNGSCIRNFPPLQFIWCGRCVHKYKWLWRDLPERRNLSDPLSHSSYRWVWLYA